MFDWTDAVTARLRDLWIDGKSSGEIAKVLGVSRNAVIGKVHRLNLQNVSRRGRISRPRAPVVRVEPAPPYLPKPRGTFIMRVDWKASKPPTPIAVVPVIKVTRAKTGKPCGILDVSGCRWPVGVNGGVIGGHVFCNDHRDVTKPYCDDHTENARGTKVVFQTKGRERHA
jgi:GcrA cell cycle regulator